jgi:8-oxo-dGTP pyrophosphatase MutT (NUDIX family)
MDKYRILVKGIVKYEDKYLIVSRWHDDRVSEPYEWSFIDGTIEFGEAPDKAVQRQIFEQTGISVTIDRPLYTWSFMMGDEFNIGITYLCLATIDTVLLSEELVDYRWIKREEFDSYINRKVMEDIERLEWM